MVYILWLFVMALAGTVLAKKMKFPYTTALVILGTIVGTFPIFNNLKLHFVPEDVFRNIVINIFLPALIGEAALKLSFKQLRENSRPILFLAIGGTLISYFTTGLLIAYILHWPLQTALVFGALMAATDPISVISIFKSLGVNKKLEIIMEGESLANDGVAIVLFKLTVFSYALIASSGWGGIGLGVFEFLKLSLGGIVIGDIFGFIASRIISHFDDYPLENSISIALFLGTGLPTKWKHILNWGGLKGSLSIALAMSLPSDFPAKLLSSRPSGL